MPINYNINRQKNYLWIFQINKYGVMWIPSKRQVWNRNIEFSIADFRLVIKFVVMPSTLKFISFQVFKIIRLKSPNFQGNTYILPPYCIRYLKIWIYNRLQWSQKSLSNLYQANRSKKIQNLLNIKYVTTIMNPLFLIF